MKKWEFGLIGIESDIHKPFCIVRLRAKFQLT
jgi:hypothetical protein